MEKPVILILGKLPPPYMGPAVATKIILEAEVLSERFDLHHFDTRINASVAEMGKFRLSKLAVLGRMYSAFRRKMIRLKPALVLIPIAQTSGGFIKDIPFIRIAEAKGAKVLVQLRGSEFRDMYFSLGPLRQQMVRSAMARVHAAVVLGENLRYIFKDFLPGDRIFVVPNGGDFSFPKRKNTKLRVTYLANCLPGKGLKEVLEAFEILSEQKDLPAFEFHAFGSWDNPAYRADCEAAAQRPGMEHCMLRGPVSGDAKWQALADSDIFVFAPKSPEGHPWSLVEAAAAGLPLISTERGAIPQNVIDGRNGFLLKDPEPQLLAKALKKLLTDPELRRSMGEASRQLYEAHFTGTQMAVRLRDVAESVLGRSEK